ncbi:MAG: hypothetical protein N2112_15650, partial [Gemmataceae bacterium]|nr:hypothetical protein [Gemmataceae bacterium]
MRGIFYWPCAFLLLAGGTEVWAGQFCGATAYSGTVISSDQCVMPTVSYRVRYQPTYETHTRVA